MDNKDKAQELRQEAQAARDRAEESFRRSDTDGFVSQWASGLTAQLKERQAEIAENGGSIFVGLYEGQRRVNAKIIHGKYGRVWMLSDSEAERFGRRFVPLGQRIEDTDDDHVFIRRELVEGSGITAQLLTKPRLGKVQKELGLCQRHELAPAAAKIAGSGTGLSGNAWVEVFRIDEYGTKWTKEDK